MPDSASARVPRLPLKEAKAAADQAGVPDYMAELSIFQVLLNHPTLARALNDLLATMLWHGKLDRRLRELVIMRIGWLTACDYEWTQHWRVACGLGVPADDLLAVRDWPSNDGFGTACGAHGHGRGRARRRCRHADVGGVRAGVRRRSCGVDRVGHRDRGVANDRLDPAQPGGAVGGRRLQLAAGWSATESISLREFLARRETTPGSSLLFPSLCRPTAEIAASGRLTDDRCRERTAMMPTRHRSRAQNRAHRVAAERRQNRKAREARSNQWVSAYFGPAPPSGEDDEPPPF